MIITLPEKKMPAGAASSQRAEFVCVPNRPKLGDAPFVSHCADRHNLREAIRCAKHTA